NIDDKLTCGFNVVERILPFPVTAADHRGEANDRWIGADASKEAERSKVENALQTNGGDEGNRTGHNGADHQFVNVAVIVFLRGNDHDCRWEDWEGARFGQKSICYWSFAIRDFLLSCRWILDCG